MNFSKKALIVSSLSMILASSLFSSEVYTIKTNSLEDAIKKVSKISKMPYFVDERVLEGKKSNSIQNIEGVEKALKELLKGSGLEAVIKNNTIVIRKKALSNNISLNDLGEIDVIEAGRTNLSIDESPASIKVLNKKQIEEQLAITSNSSDILGSLISSYSPSRQKMNGNGETIRGRAPLILIDGVPQSNPLRPTGREVHTIDFKMVESIEIINGATATNGIAGVGGVINIVTKKPEKDSFTQRIDIQTVIPTSKVKSETASYRVGYSLGGQKDSFDYFLSGSYEDQGLYLDGNGDPVGVDNTQGDLMNSKSYDIMAKLGYWIDDDQNVKFLINKYNIKNKHNYVTVSGDKDNNILTTSRKDTPEGDAPYNDALTTKLSYNNGDFFGMNLSTMVFNQRYEGLFGATNSSSFQDPSLGPHGTIYDQSRVKSTKYGSKLTLNKDGLLDDKLRLTFGFDTLFDETLQDLYQTGRTYVPKSDYNSISPFLMVSYELIDNLTLHAGTRYEKGEIEVESYKTVHRYNNVAVQGGEIEVDELLYNAGLVYDFQNGINVFASYSEGFSLPDVGRALRSINTPGVSLSSFENLKPIITDNYEIGLRAKKGMFDFEASVFQSSSNFGSRVYPNADGQYLLSRQKTEIRGLDLGLGLKLNEANNLNFLYSYSKGKYDSDGDNSLDAKLGALDIAPNRLLVKWSSKVNNKLSTHVQINHNFDRTFEDSKKEFNGYTLVDAVASYNLTKDTTISLGIANLFDKQYVTYYSQSAVNHDDRYAAGRGRTITLGYSFKF